MSPLFALGFSPSFLALLDPDSFDPRTGLPPVGRVAHVSHGVATLLDADGERRATLSGALRDAEPLDRPLVGDWVERDAHDRVVRVLDRRGVLVRRDPRGGVLPLAANVDTLFVTTALDRDQNPRRVERFLALARAGGAEPVVVLTKADLPDAADDAAVQAVAAAAGAAVVSTAALAGEVSALAPWTGPGRTVAFVGASGVGKSTLVNRWMGRAVAATGGLAADDRGRHTTTDRRLHRAPDGTLLVDPPGVREVGLVGEEEVAGDVFPEIAALAASCRWRDCAHDGEVGCAVSAALDAGALDPGRWAAWRKLERERAWAAAQLDPAQARALRDVWKRRAVDARRRDRERGG